MPRRLFTCWFDVMNDRYRCGFTYCPELVFFLKDTISVRRRQWHKDSKTWTFTAEHVHRVVAEARRLGFSCRLEGVDPDTSDEPASPSPDPDTDALIVAFFRLLPPAALKSAYHNAAIRLHADHGGDVKTMQKLNELWAQLERELLVHQE